MSSLATNIPQIAVGQGQKEETANELFAAASPSMIFGRNADTTAALTWGALGGAFDNGTTIVELANQTVVLSASATNYVYVTSAGVLTKVTSSPAGWPRALASGARACYEITTNATGVTNYIEKRTGLGGGTGATGPTGPTGPAGTSWSVSVNAQTGTTYTLQSTDNGVVVTLSNASAITLTVPSGLGANFACEIMQIGAGQVNVVASGITLNSYTGLTHLAGQHAAATLIAYASNVFNLSGNLSA